MHYIPHTTQDIAQLLKELNLKSIDDLFHAVPSEVCFDKLPEVCQPHSEAQIYQKFERLAAKNIVPSAGNGWLSFLGEGTYHHYVPAVVDAISSRGEFLTVYTPYQAEISQGSLQATFEFQSMIANLVGMDVANASVFDGAHALVEAALMAKRLRKGERILVSQAVHPEYLEVLRTYAAGLFEIVMMPFDPQTGVTDLTKITCPAGTFAVVIQTPNYFGCLESLASFKAFAEQHQLISIACNTEPLAWVALKPAGHYGIDIVAGEAQSLGNAPNYGGPHLGILATHKAHLRNMPGRLIGRTQDAEGKTAYVMTLTTREQHIRRERATSNICTNQFLVALRATLYMALQGQVGLQKLAHDNAMKMTYLLSLLKQSKNLRPQFSRTVFNECAIHLGKPAQKVLRQLEQHKIIAGRDLSHVGLPDSLLINVTELHQDQDIATLMRYLDEAAA